MSYRGAPKLYSLNPKANFSEFEAWRQNVQYHLEEDDKFEPYITSGSTWKKVTAADRFRGFTDDTNAEGAVTVSREKKNAIVERILNIIANYCTHITRTILVKQTTSLEDVWNKIRTHHHIEATGANFLNLSNIKMEDDSYEDVYQRLYAFF